MKIKLKNSLVSQNGANLIFESISHLAQIENLLIDLSECVISNPNIKVIEEITKIETLQFFSLNLSSCSLGESCIVYLYQIGKDMLEEGRIKFRCHVLK